MRANIGKLGELAGVNVETIRYYEKIGLLPQPDRTASGYRQYDESHVRRLRFIRKGRDLGFGIESIRTLLSLADCPDQSCRAADSVANGHLIEIKQKIADLTALRDELARMTDCRGPSVAQCRIIDALGGGAEADLAKCGREKHSSS